MPASFSSDFSWLKSLLVKDLHSRNNETLIFCGQIKLPHQVSWANPVEFVAIVNLVHSYPVMLRNVEETILKIFILAKYMVNKTTSCFLPLYFTRERTCIPVKLASNNFMSFFNDKILLFKDTSRHQYYL